MKKLAFLAPLLLVLSFGCASGEVDGIATEQTMRSRYGSGAGESPVGVIPDGMLRDEARNRNLLLNVEYPTRPGPHPLIIFSPGFGSIHRDYVGMSAYWASQGYVVIKPGHADAGRAGERPLLPVIEDQTPANWRDRARDISFIIDSLDALTAKYPELEGKIDREKIGVGGHQYGAFTAMLVGGARTFPGATSYADPRVKAVVLMSPPGEFPGLGLTRESWTELKIPALYMTGSRDAGPAEGEDVTWRRQSFDLAAAGDKWFMDIAGAGNAAFTGRIDRTAQAVTETREMTRVEDPRRDPTDPTYPRNPVPPTRDEVVRRESPSVMTDRNALGTIRSMSLAFWDTYLRNDTDGRKALEEAGSRNGVVLEKR